LLSASPGTAGGQSAGSVKLRVVDLPQEEVLRRYERKLVLVRPDGHVAWRADQPPADAAQLIDTIRGAATPSKSKVLA
jgi:hypothetical protein